MPSVLDIAVEGFGYSRIGISLRRVLYANDAAFALRHNRQQRGVSRLWRVV